jgi:hypothetical protein
MSEKKSKQLPSEMLENLVKLTAKRKYFSVMWAKYGVLNITSKPGVAVCNWSFYRR